MYWWVNWNCPRSWNQQLLFLSKFLIFDLPAAISNLLSQCKSIIYPKLSCPTLLLPQFLILSTPKTISQFSAQLHPQKLEIAEQTFNSLLQSGVISPTCNPWVSPLHMDSKKNPGEWRVRWLPPIELLSLLLTDTHPTHRIRFIKRTQLQKMFKYRAFLSLQPMTDQRSTKNSNCHTLRSIWIPLHYMPFGLKNAGSTFQRYMMNGGSSFLWPTFCFHLFRWYFNCITRWTCSHKTFGNCISNFGSQ